MFRIASVFKKLNLKRIWLSAEKVPVSQVSKPQSTSRPEQRSYYACAGSRVGPAIFFSWEDCQKQVKVRFFLYMSGSVIVIFRGLLISSRNFRIWPKLKFLSSRIIRKKKTKKRKIEMKIFQILKRSRN